MSSVIHELSDAVRLRRSDIGLTQSTLARLSGLSRATVNQLETGSIRNLSLTRVEHLLNTLGLSVHVSRPNRSDGVANRKSPPLEIAARSASVSFRTSISASDLKEALVTGKSSPQWAPHIHAFVDEASVSLLASVVDQLHEEAGMERRKAWAQMRLLARALKSNRELWQ